MICSVLLQLLGDREEARMHTKERTRRIQLSWTGTVRSRCLHLAGDLLAQLKSSGRMKGVAFPVCFSLHSTSCIYTHLVLAIESLHCLSSSHVRFLDTFHAYSCCIDKNHPTEASVCCPSKVFLKVKSNLSPLDQGCSPQIKRPINILLFQSRRS